MNAAKLALEISLGYAAFSFLCGGVWMALGEFIRALEIHAGRNPAGWTRSRDSLYAAKTLR